MNPPSHLTRRLERRARTQVPLSDRARHSASTWRADQHLRAWPATAPSSRRGAHVTQPDPVPSAGRTPQAPDNDIDVPESSASGRTPSNPDNDIDVPDGGEGA